MTRRALTAVADWALIVLVALAAFPAGCSRTISPPGRQRAVVTTSWLECVLRDVSGDAFEVVRLCPPGSCPGHFDMKPSQMDAVRNSRLLLRFDFQEGLDEKIRPVCGKGLRIVSVTPGEGLCVPENYLRACREVTKALSAADPQTREAYARSVTNIERRLERLETELRLQVKEAGLAGAKVLSSRHQAAFCRWLGLEVADVFGADDADNPRATARIIENAESERVACVVANLQEGDRQAKALAQRLGVPMVVFSNFPDMSDKQQTFDDLLRANVGHLIEASRK
jgi:zinc transport system substrate-binding protein